MTKQEIQVKIIKELDNIPPIPDNIIKIKELIKNPKSSVDQIAKYVKRDPALTADLLRIANSAWYMTASRVGTAERAITTIGLNQLETIITSIGAKKVLSERYEFAEEIWDHSYKCAFYAQQLAKMKRLNQELENSFTAGLLHDIGKLILLSLDPKLVQKIIDLSEAKNVDIHQVEKLAIGLSHAQIGEKIAANWNFPSPLTLAIGHHHDPKLAKDDDRTLTYITYLSNILCKQSQSVAELFIGIDPKVMEFFEIDSEQKLESIKNTMDRFYQMAGEAQKV